MNSKIAKIFAVALIPIIILASGGINLFVHFCHDIHKKEVSFLTAPDCEHHHKHQTCFRHFGHEHFDENSCASCCEDSHVFIKTVNSNFFDFEKISISRPSIYSLLHFEAFALSTLFSSVCEDYRYIDYVSPPIFSPKYISVYNKNLRVNC